MATAGTACHACGKSEVKLLLCGRCRNVWFCNRECQVVARKELGHRGANCRAAGRVESFSPAAPSQLSTATDAATLGRCYASLITQAREAHLADTRIGLLSAAERYREAAAVADLIPGANGSCARANAERCISYCLFRSGNMAAAARATCSSLRTARTSGNRTLLVSALSMCGQVARDAPGEMAAAERESREQERLSGPLPSYGGFELLQEGRISLPATPAALSRLSLAYNEAAVAICDASIAAAGGRGSPAAAFSPMLQVETQARGCLGTCLHIMGEETQRSLELTRQAVALLRQAVRTAAPGHQTVNAQRVLVDELSSLGGILKARGSEGVAEAEAYLREALAICDNVGVVQLTVNTLRYLINLCGETHASVGPAEAKSLCSRLNQLLVQMGREPETSCSICLEPLAPPADGAAEDATSGGGSGGAGGPADSCVRVLNCNHQFHDGCLLTWLRTTSSRACPLCKK